MRFLRPIAILLALLPALPAAAESAAQKGERIARSAGAAGQGFGDLVVEGEMILKTARGARSTRRFESKVLEQRPGEVHKTILKFLWPGDIRGTALLTHSIAGRPDTQWLYLPSVGRVKKISGANRAGSFVGSEFAYEDMVDQEARNFAHLWLRDEPCPAGQGICHVLSRTSKQRSGYSRQLVWIGRDKLRYRMIRYFDRRGERLKTLTITGYRLYKDRFWRPSRMTMVNHRTGKSTELKWSNYRFGVGLSAREFSRDALTR